MLYKEKNPSFREKVEKSGIFQFMKKDNVLEKKKGKFLSSYEDEYIFLHHTDFLKGTKVFSFQVTFFTCFIYMKMYINATQIYKP